MKETRDRARALKLGQAVSELMVPAACARGMGEHALTQSAFVRVVSRPAFSGRSIAVREVAEAGPALFAVAGMLGQSFHSASCIDHDNWPLVKLQLHHARDNHPPVDIERMALTETDAPRKLFISSGLLASFRRVSCRASRAA